MLDNVRFHDSGMPMTIETTAGGLQIIYGGTKTRVVLSRPWQRDISIEDIDRCPFCNRAIMDKESARVDDIPELQEPWFVAGNAHTQYAKHKLIIPANHWDTNRLRNIGGKEAIFDILRISQKEVDTSGTNDGMRVGMHIGPYAGQNLSHFHAHMIPSDMHCRHIHEITNLINRQWTDNPLLQIHEWHEFRALAHGIRAGQCFIVPPRIPEASANRSLYNLARILCTIIELYNHRFRSEQSLPPDFMLSLTWKNGVFAYGTYIPILNHWGFADYSGLTEQLPIGLPWPHEETVKHLLQK